MANIDWAEVARWGMPIGLFIINLLLAMVALHFRGVVQEMSSRVDVVSDASKGWKDVADAVQEELSASAAKLRLTEERMDRVVDVTLGLQVRQDWQARMAVDAIRCSDSMESAERQAEYDHRFAFKILKCFHEVELTDRSDSRVISAAEALATRFGGYW